MEAISERQLRRDSSEVLRRAEAGEELVVTVDGRPVAVPRPYRRQWVPRKEVRALLATPTDPREIDDLRET